MVKTKKYYIGGALCSTREIRRGKALTSGTESSRNRIKRPKVKILFQKDFAVLNS